VTSSSPLIIIASGPVMGGVAPAITGDVEQDLLSITAVHPMREDAVSAFLARAGADWPVVRRLMTQGQLVATEYEGQKFYVRKLHQPLGEE
jgi:hypothetical protein